MDLADLEKAADEAPIVKLVNLILTEAVKKGASDIHMEPYEKEYRVRFRVDGMLKTIMSPPMKLKDAITSRVKIMAKLDISEKRLPQDGRIMLKVHVGGKKKALDYRVSTLPTLWGEKIVIRLLDKENLRLDMTKLGFEQESLTKFEKAILKPEDDAGSSSSSTGFATRKTDVGTRSSSASFPPAGEGRAYAAEPAIARRERAESTRARARRR